MAEKILRLRRAERFLLFRLRRAYGARFLGHLLLDGFCRSRSVVWSLFGAVAHDLRDEWRAAAYCERPHAAVRRCMLLLRFRCAARARVQRVLTRY